jgi:hypothetical protein
VKIFAPLQIAQNQRTFEQNRQFHWVVSPSLFVRISTGKVELQHDCIADIMESMGDIPMLDMGMPKPKGEWLANACLFAPEGTEIQAGQASIEIAGNKKTSMFLVIAIGEQAFLALHKNLPACLLILIAHMVQKSMQ